jgi:hypothetical protein
MAKRKQAEPATVPSPVPNPLDTSPRAEMDRRLARGDHGGALKLARALLKAPPDPETQARARQVEAMTRIDMAPVWVLVGMLVVVLGVFVNNIVVRNQALATTPSPVEVEKSVVKRALEPATPRPEPSLADGGTHVPPG